jgi:hypothetical protein
MAVISVAQLAQLPETTEVRQRGRFRPRKMLRHGRAADVKSD